MKRVYIILAIILMAFGIIGAVSSPSLNGLATISSVDGVANPSKINGVYGYFLKDDFTTALSAGSVNGTACEPGPGTRNATAANVAITGGAIVSTGDGTWGHAGWYIGAGRTRVPGLLMGMSFKSPVNGETGDFGATSTTNFSFPGYNWNGFTIASSLVLSARGDAGATSPALYSFSANTEYPIMQAFKTAGRQIFLKDTVWRLLWVGSNGTDSPLYPGGTQLNAVALTNDKVKCPTARYLAPPLAFATFAAVWGSTEGYAGDGGYGVGGGSLAWTTQLGTYVTSGGKANATAIDGTKNVAIATVDCGNANVYGQCDLARAAGSVGNVWRYIDADNYLFSYHDGTNFVLKQRLATVETTLLTAAATYSAGATGVVALDGNSAYLFYNNVRIGAVGTINAAFAAATQHGLYTDTVNVGNTQDNFAVYARGTGGEYVILDSF